MERAHERPGGARTKAKRITMTGWGLFFIWLGAVLMFKAGIGLILIGVGVISLGMQVSRRYVGLDSDGFWILVALLFVLVGVWELFDVKLPLMPLALVVPPVQVMLVPGDPLRRQPRRSDSPREGGDSREKG